MVPSYSIFMEKLISLGSIVLILPLLLLAYLLFKFEGEYIELGCKLIVVYIISFFIVYSYFTYKYSTVDNTLDIDIIYPSNVGNFIGVEGGLFYVNSVDGLYYWTKNDNIYQRHLITGENIKYLETNSKEAKIFKVYYNSLFKENEIIVHVPKGTISNNLEYININ